MNNYERIKAMSEIEMARFIEVCTGNECMFCLGCSGEPNGNTPTCTIGHLMWLQSDEKVSL